MFHSIVQIDTKTTTGEVIAILDTRAVIPTLQLGGSSDVFNVLESGLDRVYFNIWRLMLRLPDGTEVRADCQGGIYSPLEEQKPCPVKLGDEVALEITTIKIFGRWSLPPSVEMVRG